MSKWLSAKKLSQNLGKTSVIKFVIKNSPQYPLNIGYNAKYKLLFMKSALARRRFST
jgi:hypothetical protein